MSRGGRRQNFTNTQGMGPQAPWIRPCQFLENYVRERINEQRIGEHSLLTSGKMLITNYYAY